MIQQDFQKYLTSSLYNPDKWGEKPTGDFSTKNCPKLSYTWHTHIFV